MLAFLETAEFRVSEAVADTMAARVGVKHPEEQELRAAATGQLWRALHCGGRLASNGWARNQQQWKESHHQATEMPGA
ncbi:hypothetical protein STEG23_036889 [Scotinomys teguina]